jgi:hypothetical protein
MLIRGIFAIMSGQAGNQINKTGGEHHQWVKQFGGWI